MVTGKGRRYGWFLPLFVHSSIHGILTALIVAFCKGDIVLGLIVGSMETVAHFIIDRLKASPHIFGKYNDTKTSAFWNFLGADQLAHQLCYALIITYL